MIPHRPPILCIDRVLAVSTESAVAECHVNPTQTALWEPALIEGFAQTAAVVNGSQQRPTPGATQKGMLVGVRDLQILRLPRGGETIRYEVQLVKKLGALTLFQGRATIEGEEIARGSLKFYVEET